MDRRSVLKKTFKSVTGLGLLSWASAAFSQIFPFTFWKSPAALTFAFGGTAGSTTQKATHTYNGLAYGAAVPPSATRVIFGLMTWEADEAAGRTISSGTIDGVAISAVIQVNSNGHTNNRGCAIFRAIVPTGTSGNVSITMSGNDVYDTGVQLWSMDNYQSLTPADTDSDSTEGCSVTLDCPAGGLLLAVFSSDATTNLSNITAQLNTMYGDTRLQTYYANPASAQVNLARTQTTDDSNVAVCAASWR